MQERFDPYDPMCLIRYDYEGTWEVLRTRESYQIKNHRIIDPDFVAPTVEGKETLPLGHPEGEYQYYIRVKKTLERILLGKKVSQQELQNIRAPPYVEFLAGYCSRPFSN